MVRQSLTHRLGVSIQNAPLSCVKPDDESAFALVKQVLRCAVRPSFPFLFILGSDYPQAWIFTVLPYRIFACDKKVDWSTVLCNGF